MQHPTTCHACLFPSTHLEPKQQVSDPLCARMEDPLKLPCIHPHAGCWNNVEGCLLLMGPNRSSCQESQVESLSHHPPPEKTLTLRCWGLQLSPPASHLGSGPSPRQEHRKLLPLAHPLVRLGQHHLSRREVPRQDLSYGRSVSCPPEHLSSRTEPGQHSTASFTCR